jgi:hypothetical protein
VRCAFWVALPSVAAAAPIDEFLANVERGGAFAPGELLVRTAPDLDRARLDAVAGMHGCRVHHRFGARPLYRVECAAETPMFALIESWQARRGIEWVEAAFYDELEAVPNDLATVQWYHDNTGQVIDTQTGIAGADMSSVIAWDVVASSPTRKVALIDVGIYRSHLDLANVLWVNGQENCTNGFDDDGNGYPDDCYGRDVGDDDNDPSPLTLPALRDDGSECLRWHATYIAGLIGAEGNNNNGIAGTTWDVQIINIKRHPDATCRSTTTRTVEAIAYAVDNGADAIGMAFSSSSYSSTFEQILLEAEMRGVITVMSAGNGGSNIDLETRYPNDYAINRKIIVGSTDNRDQLDLGSNYGPTKVDLAVPGTLVVSTAIDDPMAYGYGTGTSMSVGFAMGAVTLAYAAYPQSTPDAVMNAILSGSTYLPNLDCNQAARCVRTGRRLDLLGMFAAASSGSPPSLSISGVTVGEVGNGDGTIQRGERGTLVIGVANGGPGPSYGTRATLSIPGAPVQLSPAEVSIGTIAANASRTGVQGPSFEVLSTCVQDFTAALQLTVADPLGHSTTAALTVNVACPMTPPPPDAGIADSGPLDSGAPPPPDSGLPMDAMIEPDAGGETDAGDLADATIAVDAGDTGEKVSQPPPDRVDRRRRTGGCSCSASGARSEPKASEVGWTGFAGPGPDGLLTLLALPLLRRGRRAPRSAP